MFRNTVSACQTIRCIGMMVVVLPLIFLSGDIIIPVLSFLATYGVLIAGERVIKI